MLKKYKAWVEVRAGSPKKMSTPKKTSTPKKLSPKKTASFKEQASPDCPACKELGPMPSNAPEGKQWIRSWILVKDPVVVATDSSTSTSASFEELILHKIKDSSKKETKKQKKIDVKTRVVTDDDFYQAIKEKEGNEPKKRGIRKRGRSSYNTVQGGAECNISAGKRKQTESNMANDETISDDSLNSNDSQSDSKETNNGKEVGEK